MQRIAIVGARELSRRLIHIFESTGFAKVVGLFDDLEPVGSQRHGRPILGGLTSAPGLHGQEAFQAVAIGVGYQHFAFRERAATFLREHRVPLATFVHPTVTLDPTATLGAGTLVLSDCTIEMGAVVEENVFLSPRCFVSHDVTLGAHTFCAPAVRLGGRTSIGRRCFLGIGTTTIDRIRIADDAQTAAGAVVVRDVPAGALVAGVPAAVKRGGPVGKPNA